MLIKAVGVEITEEGEIANDKNGHMGCNGSTIRHIN